MPRLLVSDSGNKVKLGANGQLAHKNCCCGGFTHIGWDSSTAVGSRCGHVPVFSGGSFGYDNCFQRYDQNICDEDRSNDNTFTNSVPCYTRYSTFRQQCDCCEGGGTERDLYTYTTDLLIVYDGGTGTGQAEVPPGSVHAVRHCTENLDSDPGFSSGGCTPTGNDYTCFFSGDAEDTDSAVISDVQGNLQDFPDLWRGFESAYHFNNLNDGTGAFYQIGKARYRFDNPKRDTSPEGGDQIIYTEDPPGSGLFFIDSYVPFPGTVKFEWDEVTRVYDSSGGFTSSIIISETSVHKTETVPGGNMFSTVYTLDLPAMHSKIAIENVTRNGAPAVFG